MGNRAGLWAVLLSPPVSPWCLGWQEVAAPESLQSHCPAAHQRAGLLFVWLQQLLSIPQERGTRPHVRGVTAGQITLQGGGEQRLHARLGKGKQPGE